MDVTLSGELGFVPLDELLRLLARIDKPCAVEVRGGVNGRVFMSAGGIGLATTVHDQALATHLARAGVIDEGSAAVGGTALVVEDRDRLVAALREISVEALHRMEQHGVSFTLTEDESSVFTSPVPFDVEALIGEARIRAREWDEIGSVVGDLDTELSMVASASGEVGLRPEQWRLLAALGGGGSVRSLAVALGTTEFDAGRVAAELIQSGLLSAGASMRRVAPGETATGPRPADEGMVPEVDPNRSWWVEPEQPGGAETVADDTEAFLEKVFSQLENGSEPDEQDTEEQAGHGLLRRRRMGAVLRELDEDEGRAG